MNFCKIFLQTIKKQLSATVYKSTERCFSNVIKEELKVQTFSDIHINLPYHVDIKPLDVHKHSVLDKVKIELIGVDSARQSVKHVQNGNNVQIFAGNNEFDGNITCHITAPIKANLNITAHGNISTGFFNGSRLILKSTSGSIFVDKYNGEQIDLKTDNGNIVLKGAVTSANIKAQIVHEGSIKTRRLQGLNGHLKTNRGDIVVDASYCDDCFFETKRGNMDLQNIHKNSRIYVDEGNLTINGLDGQLDAKLISGNADIQLTRILNDSKITIVDNGDLTLRVSEECQENTMFEILSKEHNLDTSIKLIPCRNNRVLYLAPPTEEYKKVFVNCRNSLVQIQSASWMSMLKLNLPK